MGKVRSARGWIAASLIVGLGARLVLAGIAPANFDQLSYGVVVSILDHGGNVYAETARYNYSPVWMWLLLAIDRVAILAGVPFAFAVRSFLTGVDLADAILLGVVAARLGYSREKAISAYLLNPVGILLTGMHGQFENLAALPLLLALALAVRKEGVSGRWIWALGAAAILAKHIVLFSAWALFVWAFKPAARAVLYFGLAVLVFLLSFLPYLPGGADGILHHVFLYSSLTGYYGLGLLDGVSLVPGPVLLALFVGAMLAWPVLENRWQTPVAERLEFMAVAFLALTPGISQQYFLLPIVFGAWRRGTGYWIFTACALPEVFVHLVWGTRVPLIDYLILWTLSWAGALTWFIVRLIEWRRVLPTLPAAPARSAVTGR